MTQDQQVTKAINEIVYPELMKEPKYLDSGISDIKGNPILEGSIINADGYNSDVSNPNDIYVHSVEFYEGQFGSCVYSDFEPLSCYKTIEVIGHVKDYAHKIDTVNNGIDGFEWSGNLGETIKKEPKGKEVNLEMLLMALDKKGYWIYDFSIEKGIAYFAHKLNVEFISWKLNTPYANQSEETKKAIESIFLTSNEY